MLDKIHLAFCSQESLQTLSKAIHYSIPHFLNYLKTVFTMHPVSVLFSALGTTQSSCSRAGEAAEVYI